MASNKMLLAMHHDLLHMAQYLQNHGHPNNLASIQSRIHSLRLAIGEHPLGRVAGVAAPSSRQAVQQAAKAGSQALSPSEQAAQRAEDKADARQQKQDDKDAAAGKTTDARANKNA